MPQRNQDLADVCLALIETTEELSQQVIALTNLSAFLLREVCMMRDKPMEHFSVLEAEIGGHGEAIAIGLERIREVPASSVAITVTLEQALRQGRLLLEKTHLLQDHRVQ